MAEWTYQSAGTKVSSGSGGVLTPGAPPDLAVDDLELLFTGQRTPGASGPGAITGWTLFASPGYSGPASEIWGRFATGGADDTPTIDWDGTNYCYAWIERWTGGGFANIATIVAHSATETTTNSTGLRLPAFTPATADGCTVIAHSTRNNTATDATTISHTSLTVRNQYLATASFRLHAASASLHQTTAADYDGTDFTIDGTSENLGSRGVVVYLRTADAATGGLVLPTMYRKPNVLLRM